LNCLKSLNNLKLKTMKNRFLLIALFLLVLAGIGQSQTVITGLSEDFEDPWTADDSAFWAPNGGYVDNQAPDDTLIFTVNRMDDGTGNQALHIALLQKNFFDGQMYLLKDVKDQVLDATMNPVASFRVRIDSATWLIPDWGQGGILVPSTDVPFQISFFVGDNRLSSYAYRVPIDGEWHEYVFNLNAEADLTAIEKILIESVDWPNANKAYYWFDDFKVGDSVTAFIPLTSVDITGVEPVTVNNQQLQLGADYLPAEASFKEVTWSVIPVTGNASIDADGKLTPVADGDVKVVATAKDVSGVSDTSIVTLTNQYDTITTYSQGFNDVAAVNMFLWAPNKGYMDAAEPYDTLMFTVTAEDNALHILERQKSFADGQMYDFKTGIGKIIDQH
jgi:Bacterial Ig-like domain (group 2)